MADSNSCHAINVKKCNALSDLFCESYWYKHLCELVGCDCSDDGLLAIFICIKFALLCKSEKIVMITGKLFHREGMNES